jgi:outer membrane protein OmpA-like peptidoglycan-associated protein
VVKIIKSFKALAVLVVLISSRFLFANVVGADTQNFNPITSGIDFVTVHSSETLEPGYINLGVFLNYAVNSLPNYEGDDTSSRTNFQDTLLSSDVNFGLGLTKNWDLGISFPAVLKQSVESDVDLTRGEFASTGLTEIRFNTKFRIYGDNSHGLAAIFSVNNNLIEDNPFAGSGAGNTYNIEVALDKSFGKMAVGVNGGYRIRSPGEQLDGVPIDPLPSQWLASIAASYLLEDQDTKLIAEIFTSYPAASVETAQNRALASAEILGGIKTDITTGLAFHAGAGTEIFNGTSSPDWRVYTGLNYTFGPAWQYQQTDALQFKRVKNGNYVEAYFGQKIDNAFERVDSSPGGENFIIKDLLFEFASDRLTPQFEKKLAELVSYLRKAPQAKMMTIGGHTDSVGRDEFNLELSKRRAKAVRAAVIRIGWAPDKIKAFGFGETKPIADNGNFQGRALNRRVEFRIER